MTVTKKQIPNEGEPKGSPSLVPVHATVKMIYAGKTIFPGNTMICTPHLANALMKAGMAEPGMGNGSRVDSAFLEPEEPSAPLTTALEPPRNAMMPRAKFRKKGGRR